MNAEGKNMGGIKVSTTPNEAGACEGSVSLYVIDSSFKGAGKRGPLPPTNCAANRKEADNMCSYENLKVRASFIAPCSRCSSCTPLRLMACWQCSLCMCYIQYPCSFRQGHLTDECCAVGAAGRHVRAGMR